MRYYLIRHGKTDANRVTRSAYGKQGAPLNQEGQRQAELLYDKLLALGIAPEKEIVAVSELLRAQQTAEFAGFRSVITNSILNEVNTIDPQKTTEDLKRGVLAEEAMVAARQVLAYPPKEKVWVTHGQLIAAILAVLGQAKSTNSVPDFCEITEVDI